MLTRPAARSRAQKTRSDRGVANVRALIAEGWTSDQIRAQVSAGRWQRMGRVVILHNGEPTADDLRAAALALQGPRAVLTAFSALESWGLSGWPRDEIHLLVPRGARVGRADGLALRLHYTDRWDVRTMHMGRRLHRPAHAAVLAATTFRSPRPACGVLAATAQHRLVRLADLAPAVAAHPRIRHRAVLLAAAQDIAQGSQALSEIDFARLCRAAALPEPARQTIRNDRFGRKRYLDAEWSLPDGRSVVVEVDGALHLVAPQWWADQLRQNELVIAGDTVLRYPSVVVRCEGWLVVDQLRRLLSP